METVLNTAALTKHYGAIRAVDGIDLHVERGSVYGILGPNGSGKTTTLGMLMGAIQPTAGSFSWFGNGQRDENRKRIGCILEHPIFYPYLSGEQNLRITAGIKGVPEKEIDKVLALVELSARKKSAAATYSLGMKQRMALAAALLGDPEVLVLDEPTNGLDPQGIAEIRGLVRRVSEMGKTILIASHLLDEIEKVCTHVAVIKNGNLLAQGAVGEILGEERLLEVGCLQPDAARQWAAAQNGIRVVQGDNGMLLFYLDDAVAPEKVNRLLVESGLDIYHLQMRKKRLEESFLEITA
ncbi:MAG: ABC transporter ATP-binding protein [Sphingobacteriales bacterium BACL12 MAG-120813-bin55]|nr:MAG: ABC transporter ATP-binding protein [Sphingobacteriales bacterium BACL12 MAG-120802-bin5]KRP13874.1 MAG: ABC transporter ATP-binding protein [Sphingobacteriales bacterium BACL12 MAG-120813-bin55]